MKKLLILYFSINLLMAPAYALDFDLSVDEEIRKNYNPTKIEEDAALPMLPGILSNEQNNTTAPASTMPVQKNTVQNITTHKSVVQKITVQKAAVPIKRANYVQPVPKVAQGNYATLKAGTKIRAKLITTVSDRNKRGTKISFVSKYPVSTTYFTIPSGTVFQGEIVQAHKPQLSGNGGLLVINVNSMILGDETQPINAYVTKANNKKIFFNKIKGKRRYLKSVAKSMQPGFHFFKKMMKVTSNLANDGSSVVLTPFSVTAGLLVLGTNTAASPVFALFRKGDTLSLKNGCEFEMKLSQDVFIYH